MKIKIPYSTEKIELDTQESLNIEIIHSRKIYLANKGETIKNSLDNPLNCLPFEEWINKNNRFLFIVNDAARPTPTSVILYELNKKMNLEQAKYIIATGIHKKPSDGELQSIFGKFYQKIKSNILIHDAKDNSKLRDLGTTKRGTKVWINKEVLEAGAIITIGSVEPHYFAGFTGGRKSFIPGLAGYTTIEKNHKLALQEGADPLNLEKNPVHIDLLEALKKIPPIPIFSIQSIVKNESELCGVFCGDIHESFSKASASARDIFGVSIKEKADIVITVVRPPLDKNLYQAHKAIEHGKLALKEDGILILVAACTEGIGPDNFYKLLSSSKDLNKILKIAKKNYRLGYHKAARIAELSKRAEIWAISEIKNEILKKAFIKPFNSLQEAFIKAINKKGPDSKILILMDGGNTVPLNGK